VEYVSGVVYIADSGNNEVRSVFLGAIHDVVGSPLATPGCSPDGSPATDPITDPTSVRLDSAGTIFYEETGCDIVREVGPAATLQTIAGPPPPGVGTSYPYNGLPATSAALIGPHGLTFVPDGAMDDLWFSDTGNNVVDAVGQVAAAGTGSSSSINSANTATGQVGQAFSFLVTTTGSPAPKIKAKGKLPKGVKFVDNLNGTATISGTPTSTKHKSAAGLYDLTFTATFGKGHSRVTATQSWALDVTK